MKISIKNELLPLNILVIILILAINFIPSSVVRIVIGLPFILFFPGYTLIAALFPKKGMDPIERIALSFGMSIAIVPIIGLALNYTSWGIRLEPVLYSNSLFIVIASVIAWLKRRRIPIRERFAIEFELKDFGWSGSRLDKALSVILAVSILATIGTLIYVVAFPKVGEKFTEFYILGLSGKAADYPKSLTLGETAKVIVGVVNHEQKTTAYRVEILIGGVKNNEAGDIVLENDGKWEETLGFTPDATGDAQKVEFFIYKDGSVEPGPEQLHLWVDVAARK